MNPAGLCAGQEYHQMLKMPGEKIKKANWYLTSQQEQIASH